MALKYDPIRQDHRIILELINSRSSVLDLGCGSGHLLFTLIKEKEVRGEGVEIDLRAIYECIAKGLTVSHADIDSGLAEYNSKSFDYVVLNQSLQQIKHVDKVLQDALRVGKKVIVGFPNFVYYKSRLQIMFKGKTPVTGSLPYQWYQTPNLHFLSISDFIDYCRLKKIKIEARIYLGSNKRTLFFPNVFAQTGIFLISGGQNDVSSHPRADRSVG